MTGYILREAESWRGSTDWTRDLTNFDCLRSISTLQEEGLVYDYGQFSREKTAQIFGYNFLMGVTLYVQDMERIQSISAHPRKDSQRKTVLDHNKWTKARQHVLPYGSLKRFNVC